MTSLLSAKKRAEEFAAVVDGTSVTDRLHPDLAGLVDVVETLQREAQAGARLAPRAEFTASLREQLMAEAATSLAQDNILTLPPRRKGSRERRLALVASSLVLVGGTAGMAAAAQSALPGEALYPIKRGLENAQAGLTTSPTGRGKDLLAQADTRLVEVQGLFEREADLSQVPTTIDDFTAQATEASDLLLEEFEQERDPAIIEELLIFASANLDELRDLAKTAAPEHQDELAAAAEVLIGIDEQARAACPTCGDSLDALEMPTLFLAANEVRDAMEAVGGAKMDNDHPVITEDVRPEQPTRDTKDKAPTGEDDQTVPDDTDTDGTDGGDGTQGTDGGDGGQGGDGAEPGLPDLPTGDVDVKNPGGGKGVGETVDEGTKGAGEAAKDALPGDLDDVADIIVP